MQKIKANKTYYNIHKHRIYSKGCWKEGEEYPTFLNAKGSYSLAVVLL